MTHFKTLRSLLLTSAMIAAGGMAHAGGTTPGTNVSNSIDISYSSGGNTINRTNAASVSFVVDRKVDLLLQGQDAGGLVTVQQGSNVEQLTYRLVNQGNDASGYDIDVANSGAIGLTYDATGGGAEGTYSVYIGNSPGAVSGSDVLYDAAGTTNIGDVAADGEVYVKIVANIPAASQDGDTDAFDVTATALDAGTNTITTETASPSINTVDTILADPGTNGFEVVTESYKVTAPVLSATKTSTIASENIGGSFTCASDPVDPAAKAYVPGGCVEYTITVTNDGAASSAASNLSVSDAIPGDLTFAGILSQSGFDNVSESGGTVTATAASLAPGSTATTVVRATIN